MAIFNTVYGGEWKWKPWANTLICYDFENDSWTTVINSWNLGSAMNATSSSVTYTTLASGKKVAVYSDANGGIKSNWTINIPSNFTFAFWISWNQTIRQWGFWINNWSDDWQFWFNADGYNFNLYSWVGSWKFAARSNTNFLDNDRHLIMWTYNWATNKIYVDNSEITPIIAQWNMNNSPIFSNWYVYVGKSTLANYSFIWQCGSFILEDKARTADEVANYYNKTKKNYS